MKNVVKYYKDFFGYFNALKTHGGISCSVNGIYVQVSYLPKIENRIIVRTVKKISLF